MHMISKGNMEKFYYTDAWGQGGEQQLIKNHIEGKKHRDGVTPKWSLCWRSRSKWLFLPSSYFYSLIILP